MATIQVRVTDFWFCNIVALQIEPDKFLVPDITNIYEYSILWIFTRRYFFHLLKSLNLNFRKFEIYDFIFVVFIKL